MTRVFARLRLALILILALFAARPAFAWDEITHGHLSEMAIADVKTPELKAFLHAHRDALISGTWFPDWGHALKPQGEADHSFYLDSMHAYLQRPAVRAQANYPDLLAHYLGSYAHVVEDRVVDASIKRHAPEVGEGGRDDLENGMLEIAERGWLRRDVKPYVPREDLGRIFAEARYYNDPRLNAANFQDRMARAMEKGEILNRELSLLSFLGAGYARQAYPWGEANVPTAPGGFSDNAAAVAAGWEAIWAEMHGRPTPFFVWSQPGDGGTIASANSKTSYGRILVVTRRRFDMRDLPASDVRLVSAKGETVPVNILPYIDEPNLYPYIPTVGHDLDLAFQIEATRDLTPGETYELTIAPGSYAPTAGPIAPYRIRFQVPTHPLFQARAHPPKPWAMGIFTFAFVGALGGVLFGAPDVIRLAHRPQPGRPRSPDPLGFAVFNWVFKKLGLALFAFGLWLLVTDGALFIAFLQHHH